MFRNCSILFLNFESILWAAVGTPYKFHLVSPNWIFSLRKDFYIFLIWQLCYQKLISTVCINKNHVHSQLKQIYNKLPPELFNSRDWTFNARFNVNSKLIFSETISRMTRVWLWPMSQIYTTYFHFIIKFKIEMPFSSSFI